MINQLLIPRYELIAAYPNMNFKVGDIINFHLGDEDNPYKYKTKNITYFPAYFDGFPHLFKKLMWWKNRSIEEMPHYLKHKWTMLNKKEGFTYHKIVRWDMQEMKGYQEDGSFCQLDLWQPEYEYIPIAEDEYLNSI